MEEAKALNQQQQQQQKLMLQHRQQQQQQHQQHHHQQQQQQLLLLQQLQKQQQQQAAMSRFPSNIDVHLRPIRPPLNLQQNPNSSSSPSPNSIPNLLQNQNTTHPQPQQPQHSQQSQSQMQQQQKMVQPGNQLELQMAYQDALRICRPDFKRPFSSLEDACERLLPYHVVADYEAEEDDRILDSDTTGQMLSRSQQWDNNICAKVAEFTATFEKQALAFNIISRKRSLGEFRSEERLMIEQALLQEEKRAMIELRAEIESREKAGRDAHETKLRTMAMMRAEQARAESQAHSESMARAPLRASAQANDSVHDMGVLDQGINPDEMINGWGNSAQKDENEPSEDFLNDEETENGETGTQEVWRGVGEFDLNTR